MDRIEQFDLKGKKYIALDLSNIKNNDELRKIIPIAQGTVQAYPLDSLYVLINVEGALCDSETKKILTEWMAYNKPYVRYEAIVGADGIKKMMISSVLKLAERNNARLCHTKEEAIDWLSSIG